MFNSLTRTLGALSVLMLSAGSSGCIKHIYSIDMANPMVTGTLEDNRVKARQRSLERYHQLPPRTLSNVASITALDDKRICFDMELRAIAPNNSYIDPGSWQMRIFGEPEFKNENGRVQSKGALRETDMQGMVAVTTTKTKRTCSKDAKGKEVCRDRQVKTTVKKPGTVKVTAQPFKACFANAGYVNPDTQFISLRFRRRGSIASNIYWQWDFKQ